MLSWIWTSLNFNLKIEENLVKWTSIVKRNTIVSSIYSDTISLQDYSFIDVSGYKKLINQEYAQGKIAIIDRSLLDSLFKVIKKYPEGHDFILCDVFFESPTEDDPALASTISSIGNTLFPYQYVGDSIIFPTLSNIPSAYSGYNSSSGIGLTDSFLKYTLIENDTNVGISLKMYLEMHDVKVKEILGLVWIDGRPALNTSILDIKLEPGVLTDDEGFSKVIPLEEVLSLKNDSLISDLFIKGKIVVIGDFKDDLHKSIYGAMPGALIIVNTFEAIRRGDVFIKWTLLLFLLVGYTAISYYIFYYRGGMVEHRIKRFSYPLIGTVGSRLIGFSLTLYVISVISYFTSGIHLDILAMATYLSVVSITKRRWHYRKRLSIQF